MTNWKIHFEGAIDQAQVLQTFHKTLNEVRTPQELTRLIQRFTISAGYLAGAAATLIGAFHIRQDLFRDRSETIATCGDRGAEIASCVFAAVDDEYLDRDTQKRESHRDLSQRLLKNVVAFYKFNENLFDKEFPLPSVMAMIMRDVLSAYRVNRQVTEDDLFYALGFHVANELFAENEFRIMSQWFTANYGELVNYLKENNAYGWIAAHNVVEEDHANYGLVGIERALQYYAGAKALDEMRRKVIDGLEFAIAHELRIYSNLVQSAEVLDRLTAVAV